MKTGQIVLYVAPPHEAVEDLPQVHRYTGTIRKRHIDGDSFASSEDEAALYFAKKLRKDIMQMSDEELVEFMVIKVGQKDPSRDSDEGSPFGNPFKSNLFNDLLRNMRNFNNRG
jgi:hypothetical protein